jgi:hypothetical protein
MAENVMPFDLEAFMEGVNQDCTKEKGTNNSIKRVLMNTRDNQGSVTLLPFISKKLGNIYLKLEKVREINGPTSIIDSGNAWYRILQKSDYGTLTKEQEELYDEVVGLYDWLWDNSTLDHNTMRIRRYSAFTGICLNHINLAGAQVTDNIDQPCLLVFPSNAPIDALNTAIATKRNILKERTVQWLQGIITPATKGRKGAIVITFKKPDSPGYAASVSFETNNLDEGLIVIDPNKEFDEETVAKFDDPLRVFLGWGYDSAKKSYFNEELFKQCRDVIKTYIKEVKVNENHDETAPENKNGNADPMKTEMPPVPGVEAPKPGGRPF